MPCGSLPEQKIALLITGTHMSQPIKPNTDAQFPNLPAGYTPYPDDEISLVDLVKILVKRKNTLLIVFALVFLLGFVFALTQKRTYTATQSLTPISPAVIDRLNSGRIMEFDRDRFEEDFITLLNSDRFARQFLRAESELLADIIDASENNVEATLRLRQKLKIQSRDARSDGVQPFARIAFESQDQQVALQVPERFADLASVTLLKQYQDEFAEVQASQIEVLKRELAEKETIVAQRRALEIEKILNDHELRVTKIQDQLNARMAQVKQQEADRLKSLQEAVAIAERLNIQEPTTLSRLAERNASGRFEISADVSNQAQPLFLRGVRMLQAEIDVLEQRGEDVFFDERIRELQAELVTLSVNREAELLQARENDLAFSNELIQLVERIETVQSAQFPVIESFGVEDSTAVITNISSKKALIAALSLVMAFILAIMAAFMHEFACRVRESLNAR